MRRFQLVTIVGVSLVLSACGQKEDAPATADTPATTDSPVTAATTTEASPSCIAAAVNDARTVEIVPGLASKTLTTGCGEGAVAGQTAVVHYTGWLQNLEAENNRGKKFDSSRDRDQHFSFPLGGGRVIKGWDQGVVGMSVGEVRELTIAPEMAYGDRDIGVIPPGSTLIFEVELVAVESAQPN